jgi:ABC-type molybdate transport system ATPase subunit
MAVSKDGKTLTITIDLTKTFGPSSSGKTTIIATTGGNVPAPEHDDIKVGVNIYTK